MYKHLQERYAPRPPVNVATLARMKAEGEKIAAITAYDASFATLVDLIFAEPNALISFAGPRVIQQTVKQELPEGFQRSEFLLRKGMIDGVVERKDLKAVLASSLSLLRAQQAVTEAG